MIDELAVTEIIHGVEVRGPIDLGVVGFYVSGDARLITRLTLAIREVHQRLDTKWDGVRIAHVSHGVALKDVGYTALAVFEKS